MTFIEKKIAHYARMVSRWRGGSARMHELSKKAGLALDVVVCREDPAKNLYIACIDPVFISGPVTWQNAQIELRPCVLGKEEGVELVDDQNGVKIVSYTFEVRENVKLKSGD